MSRRLRGARSAVRRARVHWAATAAVRRARRLRRAQPDAVLVCWDLDNTLVDSGSLLRLGRRLQEAIVDGAPVPNMLAFHAALGDALPSAGHVILSARTPAMRTDTLAWLSRHGLALADSTLWFVPHAAAKTRVWQTLAKAAPLVIVDDLTYDHEADVPSVYHDLVETARRTAAAYIGADEIARIAADPDAVAGVVAAAVAAVSRYGSPPQRARMRPLPAATTPYDDVLATAQRCCDKRVSVRDHARVLDAGSGLDLYVAFPPHVHVTGIDVSPELLEANTRLNDRIHADLAKVELPERSYACVICWNVLEHLEDPEPVVKKLARSVADDGLLLIGSPNPFSVKGLVTRLTPYPFHLWVYRRYVDAQANDAPGEGPYRTFMRRGGSLRAVRQAVEQLGLTVVYQASIESPFQIALRKRYRVTGAAWTGARLLTRLLSFGLIRADATDYLVIFERRARSAPTTHPESSGTA